MISNNMFLFAEFADIHEFDGMTMYIISALKLGHDFEEGTELIVYGIMTFPVTRTSMYFIFVIFEGSMCISAFS